MIEQQKMIAHASRLRFFAVLRIAVASMVSFFLQLPLFWVQRVVLILKFVYANFLHPFTKSNDAHSHQARLENFYNKQAGIYDATRSWLLRGRRKMLRILSAHICAKRQADTKPIVWIDVGGGTGM